MIGWIGYSMIVAVIALLAGICLEHAVPVRTLRRRRVWELAMTVSVVLPVVVPFLRSRRADLLAIPPSTVAQALPVASVTSDRWTPVLVWAWALMSGTGVLVLLAARRQLRERLRACRDVVMNDERVLLSDDIGPALVGVRRPRVVIPQWVMALSPPERAMVLAHETEHRRARDPLVAWTALLTAIALPWNVALWWQVHRLRQAIELDCDARVIQRLQVSPRHYGHMLLGACERGIMGSVIAAPLAASRSLLARRIDALVSRRVSTRRRLVAAIAAGGHLAPLLAIAPPAWPRWHPPGSLTRPPMAARSVEGITSAPSMVERPSPASADDRRPLRVNVPAARLRRASDRPAPARLAPAPLTATEPTAPVLPAAAGFVRARFGGGLIARSANSAARAVLAEDEVVVTSGYMRAEIRRRGSVADTTRQP